MDQRSQKNELIERTHQREVAPNRVDYRPARGALPLSGGKGEEASGRKRKNGRVRLEHCDCFNEVCEEEQEALRRAGGGLG